jgi:prepilin-type N-terminal cleavage/methylation domain-containing protein
MSPHTRRPCGFSLLEVMIVIAILGMLAAVAIPQLTSHKPEGRTAAMVGSLSILRTAVDSYWTQHDAFPGPTAAEFADQLLKQTSKAGKVGEGDGFRYGPYLRSGVLPTNPITSTATVKCVDVMPKEPSGSQAWIYCTATGEVRSNAPGKGPDGVAYFDL